MNEVHIIVYYSIIWANYIDFSEVDDSHVYVYMAASQNARSGSTPKTHRRSRPPIQTSDPDRSRPHDPDLWSRPLCLIFVRHLRLQSTEKYYSALQSTGTTPVPFCTTKCYNYKVLKGTTFYYKLQYYSVLQSTTLYYKVIQSTILGDLVNFGKFGHPVPDLVPDRSRPVPDQFQTSSTASVHSQPCCPRRKNRFVRPAQNHLIHFKSSMKWLSWFQALRSRCAEKTFYESGRSRRPDHRGTIQTRLSTHAHIVNRIYVYI